MDSEQTGMEITQGGTVAPAENGRALSRIDAHGAELMDMIKTALTSNVDVEKLERLMAMKERYDAQVAKQAYLDSLRAFQSECPEIPKKKGVWFDRRAGAKADYHYAPLETITRIIDPILRRHGLSYSWTTEGITDGSLNVVCVLRHDGGHEERVPFPVPMATNAKMSAAQKAGSAETYGMRRSLISILGLTTAEDDMDGREVEDPADVQTITDKQAAALDDLAEEAGANKAAFCKHLGIASLADLPADRFDAARDLLNQKLDKKRGGT